MAFKNGEHSKYEVNQNYVWRCGSM